MTALSIFLSFVAGFFGTLLVTGLFVLSGAAGRAVARGLNW